MLYLVKRVGYVDYDDYRGFLVKAETPGKAFQYCLDFIKKSEVFNFGNFVK